MTTSKLFVELNESLKEEANKTVDVVFTDGENEIALNEANLPPEVDYKNPYAFDLARFIPNTKLFTLDRFFELAKNLIDDASARSGQPTVPLVEEYPPLDMARLGEEVITYRVISRQPANLSADAEKRPQRSFRTSYTTKDPQVGDNIIEVMNRPLDHEIEFNCWALSNKLANKRAIWLENLFISHAWVFRSQGADRFYFQKRLSDGYMTSGQQRLLYRPLRFFLRFNEFLSKANYEIKNIELNLKLSTEI